jgi:SET domain-containing protein
LACFDEIKIISSVADKKSFYFYLFFNKSRNPGKWLNTESTNAATGEDIRVYALRDIKKGEQLHSKLFNMIHFLFYLNCFWSL